MDTFSEVQVPLKKVRLVVLVSSRFSSFGMLAALTLVNPIMVNKAVVKNIMIRKILRADIAELENTVDEGLSQGKY